MSWSVDGPQIFLALKKHSVLEQTYPILLLWEIQNGHKISVDRSYAVIWWAVAAVLCLSPSEAHLKVF